MQTFINPIPLSPDMIAVRLAVLDPAAAWRCFSTVVRDIVGTGDIIDVQYYVEVESSLTDDAVRDMLAAPITEDDRWEVVRLQRNRLLTASDWTQLPDAALTLEEKQAWGDYRQALRDIPQDFINPDDIVFPEAPA